MATMTVYQQILAKKAAGKPQFALLLDPEKGTADYSSFHLEREPDLVLVGGSSGKISAGFIDQIRAQFQSPVVLFPGNTLQFTPRADALLFLSLLSGRNPETLIGQQVASARMIKESGIEVIPMGYILIDGGKESAVERVSHTKPLKQIREIVDTAIAAELMGKKIIYLEAGSGAKTPVSPTNIAAVRQAVSVPLIVGGGICCPEQQRAAYQAGADIVVVGNYLEQHPYEISRFLV